MKKVLLLLWLILILSCSYSSKVLKECNWQHVYTNDQNGECIYGKIENLISSIRAGKEVRMEINYGRDFIFITEANNIWIKNAVVYAQNTTSVSVHFRGQRLYFDPETYYFWFVIDTNGNMDRIRWNIGEPVMRGYDTQNVPVKWFVR